MQVEEQIDEDIKEPKELGKGFELQMENSKILRTLIDTLSSIIDETEIQITEDAFLIKAMDPSRICLIKIEITKEHWDGYECSGDYTIGLNLDDLSKIMKRSSSKDTIKLSFAPEDQKIKIIMESLEKGKIRTFSLAILDIDIEDVPLDNLLSIEYPTKWAIPTNFLTEALRDAEIYSEILNLQAIENEGLKFSAYGQIGEMEYFLGIEDLIDLQVDEGAKGSYSVIFLKAVTKLSAITEELEMALKTDHPLKMIFSLLEGGELSFFLAPRVEDTEFDEDEMEEF
jgi:proliferating cell nuclear antigen